MTIVPTVSLSVTAAAASLYGYACCVSQSFQVAFDHLACSAFGQTGERDDVAGDHKGRNSLFAEEVQARLRELPVPIR